MALIFWNVIVLYVFLGASDGTKVQWSISLPDKCVANDTLAGLCARSRTIQCVKTLSGQVIPDYYCNGTTPASFIKCDSHECQPGRCVVSMWSSWQPCDKVCSRKFSYRTRSVLWRDNDAVTCPKLVEKSPCQQCVQNYNDFYFWLVEDWGICHPFTTAQVYALGANQSNIAASGVHLCGPNIKIGRATREVKCIDTNGIEQKSEKCLNSKDKDGRITQKPDRSKVCQLACDCHMSAWSGWSGCPADCSRTEESRTRGVLYPPQLNGRECGALVEKRQCKTKCPSYQWYVSSWSNCKNQRNVNVTRCGDGFKERVVFCIESSSRMRGSEIQPVEDHLCDVATKPVAMQPCKITCQRDCMVSSWNAWEPCSITCGSAGVKRRTRSVLQTGRNGGAECPSLVQMSKCELVPCTSWATTWWSACFGTPPCGAGMKHRVVYCRGGKGFLNDVFCSGEPKPPRTANCSVPCPNDCVLSDWSDWETCSKSCGSQGGVQTRYRSILAYPSSTRPACPSADKLNETQKCNVGKLCEKDATYMWKTSTWSECEQNITGRCGAAEGVQKREVYCGNDVKNFTNDSQCGNMTKPPALKQCDIPCPKDCVLTNWTSWSECNATCQMQGVQISKRYVLQNAEHGGVACTTAVTDGVAVITRSCQNDQPCYKYTWSVTPWQDCQILPRMIITSTPSTCGAGYQTRNISCARSDGLIVETSYCFESSLEMPPKPLKECWKACDKYCVRTSWSKWSDCPNKCTRTPFVRYRTRQVVNLSPGRGGFGVTCPKLTARDFKETEDCPPIPCTSYEWSAAPFTSCIPHNSAISCGQGRKERYVFCQDQSDLSFVADSFCDQSTKPTSGENCLVNCTQDCVVSAWGKWDQQCSNSCGDSLKTRQRTVLKQTVGLGRKCPSLVDKQLCHEPACTSFTWKIGIWSTCKLTSQDGVCGNGTQTRKVSCSPHPGREWICAKQAEKPVMVQECSLACPGDCVISAWMPWSACVKSKHGCVSIRWRNIIRREHITSPKKCSGYALQEKMNCSCPSMGKIVASDWTTCMLNEPLGAECGKGMQYRSLKCKDENGMVLDKQQCSNFDATPPSRDCVIPCQVDCVMGEWSEWSRCTTDCGLDGKIQRFRNVIISGQNGGRKCPERTQSRPCNNMPCYTYTLDRGEWGKCYVDGRGCGRGTQTRETTCRRNDRKIVRLHFCLGQLKKSTVDDSMRSKLLQDVINNSSQLSLTSSRGCEVTCPGDCFMSHWSDWSECGSNCFGNSTKYYQTRSRVIISSPDAGGKACSSDLLQSRQCLSASSACIGAQWKTGAWKQNGTRAVWCETSSGVKVTGACAKQRAPSRTKSCNPACTDPNSICHEGQCLCKPNYELFQKQCIPTQGCLVDAHCIRERNVCKNEKCSCKDNYSWNATAGTCVLVEKTFTEHASTVASTTDENASTIASSTDENASTVASNTDESASTVASSTDENASTVASSTYESASTVASTTDENASTIASSTDENASTVASNTDESASTVPSSTDENASTVASSTYESASTVASTTNEESAPTVASSTEEITITASTSVSGMMTSSPGMMEKSTEGDKRTFTKPSREGSGTNPNKKALDDDGKDAITPEFWKWIGIGAGALVFFLVLAIGFYCYSKRHRKAKHRMMKLKRNTIELVGIMTYCDGPEKV